MGAAGSNGGATPDRVVVSRERVFLAAGVFALVAVGAWVGAIVVSTVRSDPLNILGLWVPVVGLLMLLVCATSWTVLRVASPGTRARSALWHAAGMWAIGGVWGMGLVVLMLVG